MAKIASCDHYPGNAIFRNRKGQALEIDDKRADPTPLFWVFGIERNGHKPRENAIRRFHVRSDKNRF
jgi:hypothetical protein